MKKEDGKWYFDKKEFNEMDEDSRTNLMYFLTERLNDMECTLRYIYKFSKEEVDQF